MENKTLFILCGESFSGKSTLAKKLSELYGAKLVGRDEIYFAMEKILALEKTPEEDDGTLWDNMWPIVVQGVKNQLSLGNSVVVDDNCLYLHERDKLRSVAKESGAKSILIYLNIPMEVLKERQEKNKTLKTRHDVPPAWIDEDAQDFERPLETESHIIYSCKNTFEDLIKKLKENL